MKYRVAGIVTIAIAFALTFVGVALASGPDQLQRHHQHEEARSLDDLAPGEREAASSTATDPETFATHLPIVSIRTGGQEIPGRPVTDEQGNRVEDGEGRKTDTPAYDGERTIPVGFSLHDNGDETPDSANRLSDAPLFETSAEMRIRGYSSAFFDKPSYRVTFTLEDRVTANPQDVLGMGIDEDWILSGPYFDKSLIRNYLSFNVFGEIMPHTPDVRYVELFLDDGYQGLYLLMETVKVSEDRVDVRKTDANATQTSFIVQRNWSNAYGSEQLDEFIQNAYESIGTAIGITYPAADDLTSDQRTWIQDELNRIEKSIYSYDYDDSDHGYRSTLDVESFVDYALINEYATNLDASSRSTYMYRNLGDRLAIGPIWDFNNAYGNDFSHDDVAGAGFITISRPFYEMLYHDESFTARCIRRWGELRSLSLSDERILSYIDDVVGYLGPAVTRNYEVWGYTLDPDSIASLPRSQKVSPDEANPTSYGEAIADLKNAIVERAAWIDEHIDTLNHYSHESLVKKFNH